MGKQSLQEIIEPSEQTHELVEKYDLGRVSMPVCGVYHDGDERREINVKAIYTKKSSSYGDAPTRESFRLESSTPDYFIDSNNLYGEYVRYLKRGSVVKKAFLHSKGVEVVKGKSNSDLFDLKRWDKDLVELVNRLPNHVKEVLFSVVS